jgi:hypothetical protein
MGEWEDGNLRFTHSPILPFFHSPLPHSPTQSSYASPGLPDG